MHISYNRYTRDEIVKFRKGVIYYAINQESD